MHTTTSDEGRRSASQKDAATPYRRLQLRPLLDDRNSVQSITDNHRQRTSGDETSTGVEVHECKCRTTERLKDECLQVNLSALELRRILSP